MTLRNTERNWTSCDFPVERPNGWLRIPSSYTKRNRPYLYLKESGPRYEHLWTYWSQGVGQQLVVLFHPYNTGADGLKHVARIVNEVFPESDILIPEYPAGIFVDANPLKIVGQITNLIDDLYAERRFEEVYFVGHSLGSVIARKIYVCAWGQTSAAPFEPELLDTFPVCKDWAPKVKRIILLAGLARDWQISHHLPIHKVLFQKIGAIIGDIKTLTGARVIAS